MYGESNSFACSLKVLVVNRSTEEMIITNGKSWFTAYLLSAMFPLLRLIYMPKYVYTLHIK